MEHTTKNNTSLFIADITFDDVIPSKLSKIIADICTIKEVEVLKILYNKYGINKRLSVSIMSSPSHSMYPEWVIETFTGIAQVHKIVGEDGGGNERVIYYKSNYLK